MSSVNRDIVCRWQEAVLAVESGRLGDARSLLWEIRHFSAKIWYNLAVVHLMENDYSAADQKFEECLLRDRYLAVAHFQRGVIACLQGRLSAAQEMFARAQEHVRNSDLIDYRQLGLALRLTQKQIEHNQGAVEKCLRKQQPVMKTSLEELEILPLAMFRPAKSLVDNLQKQQFLQEAKVVSSVPHIVRDSGDIVALGRITINSKRVNTSSVNQVGSQPTG
ncbi:NADPH oxidase activator 1-like isoform X2 [Littorina saxatilis]|uniref:NADPH oxidase activator 1-like isoform X2 n=1 Tax=Littorina saxatilis TaxID=31220 RepID=UPI0038B4C210